MSNGSGFSPVLLGGCQGVQKTSCNEKGRDNRLNFFRLTWFTMRPNAIAIAELTLAYIVIEMESSSSCGMIWVRFSTEWGKLEERLLDGLTPTSTFCLIKLWPKPKTHPAKGVAFQDACHRIIRWHANKKKTRWTEAAPDLLAVSRISGRLVPGGQSAGMTPGQSLDFMVINERCPQECAWETSKNCDFVAWAPI